MPFEGVDDDAGIYGDITFFLDSESGDHNNFEINKLNKKQSELLIKNAIQEKNYFINIMAYDGGNLRSDKTNLTLVFVDKSVEPHFEPNEWSTIFTENITGLDEIRQIPIATDPKNFGVVNYDELFAIFYFIDGKKNYF